jgi:UPF0716 protein FxsA
MLFKLFLLFVLTTTAELFLLLTLAKHVGIEWTLVIIVATALAGSAMVKWQGLGVMRRIRESMTKGVSPADALLDGAMILVAGALLLTPGVLTDALGLALLIPPSRRFFRERVKRWIKGKIRVAGGTAAPDTIDVSFKVEE